MPPKKAAAAVKPAAKPAAKPRAKNKSVAEGECYECEVCGLRIVVDDVCGCVEECDILCCGEPMKAAKPAKAAAKKAPAKKAAAKKAPAKKATPAAKK